MIKIPYEQIIERIKKEANISEEEIKTKVDEKMKQLSGLISNEGAAHIVANELGIKLFDSFTGKLQIKNILAGLRNVETVGKVLQTYELREFKTNEREGKVASLVIGDETGTIRVVMWGDQAENIKNITRDMTIKLIGGYVKDNRGNIELHMNEKSKLMLNPPGEIVNTAKPKPSERKSIADLSEADSSVEVLGTIVQIFDPRFFEICPECSKRVKSTEGNFVCNTHNNVEPDFSYVLNLIIDDGTDNMRTVFFRDTMAKLLSASKEKIMAFKDNPETFEEVKSDLLGNMVKISGRVKKNLFFDRIELITNEVTINPNPEEEIKRLDKEMKNI